MENESWKICAENDEMNMIIPRSLPIPTLRNINLKGTKNEDSYTRISLAALKD